MDIRVLRYFLAVAQEESITKATGIQNKIRIVISTGRRRRGVRMRVKLTKGRNDNTSSIFSRCELAKIRLMSAIVCVCEN